MNFIEKKKRNFKSYSRSSGGSAKSSRNTEGADSIVSSASDSGSPNSSSVKKNLESWYISILTKYLQNLGKMINVLKTMKTGYL